MRHRERLFALGLAGVVLAAGLIAGVGGWPGSAASTLLVGFPDCEAPSGGLIAQPTAAWTSLIFVVLGVWMAGDRLFVSVPVRLLVASTVAAVGLASFFGHAAVTDWARQLDSLAIKLMLVTFIVAALSRLRSREEPVFYAGWAGVAVSTLAIEVLWPAAGQALLAGLVLAAITLATLIATPETRRWLLLGLALLGAGSVAWWLGRRGGPLCAPSARFQLHGVWHILAAAGIASVYQIYRSETT